MFGLRLSGGERRFASFREAAGFLGESAGRTFTHRWQDSSYRNSMPEWMAGQLPAGYDLPGPSGQSEAPKYLYRGEPGRYPTSLSSLGRMSGDSRFSGEDLELLSALTKMAADAWNNLIADRLRSVGWPQHYGFPTPLLDLTCDPLVALHFAALTGSPDPPKERVLYRIDVEAAIDKIYAPAGGFSPLAIASIEHTNCTRATRQRAWVLCSREDDPLALDLQHTEHLKPYMERFAVDASDAGEFVQAHLLEAEDDGFAPWPLAVLRGFKADLQKPLPRHIAEWICGRVPLFNWTPTQVWYDARGRGTSLQFLSPSQAKQRDGRDYRADPQAVVDELTSPEMPVPNGIVFGMRTGGKPGTSEWLEPGEVYEFQWQRFIGKAGGRVLYQFERARLG